MCQGWQDFLCKYWCVSVGLQNKSVERTPPSPTLTWTSKKLILSRDCSLVNLMVSWLLLRWLMKDFNFSSPCVQIKNTSSMNLIQTRGWDYIYIYVIQQWVVGRNLFDLHRITFIAYSISSAVPCSMVPCRRWEHSLPTLKCRKFSSLALAAFLSHIFWSWTAELRHMCLSECLGLSCPSPAHYCPTQWSRNGTSYWKN